MDALSLLFDDERERTPTQVGGGMDMLFGAETEPPSRKLIHDPQKTMGFWSQAKASFADEEDEWLGAAAKSLYPDEPLEKSRARFGKTEEGRYYHVADDGKAYEVQAPSGMGRLANLGSGVGYALPAATGTAAGILTAPMAATGVGTAATIGAAGAGAGLGEWLRQGIGDVILGDAADQSLNPSAMATEGAFSMLGQGMGAGLGRFAERFAAPDLARMSTPQAAKATSDLYDTADRVGVRLTPGEATGLASQLAEQKRLKGVPGAFNIMDDFYKGRNRDATEAVERFLGSIARSQDAGEVGTRAARAGADVVEGTRKMRTQVTSPLFKDAEAKAGPIDASQILADIDARLGSAKGSSQALLTNIRKMLVDAKGNPDTTFAGLQNAKREIGDILSKGQFASDVEGVSRTAKANLSSIYDDLNTTIDAAVKASPARDAYAAGNKLYADITKAEVEPAKEALAPLLRLGNESSAIVRAGRAMLSPQTRSPDLIAKARSYLAPKHPEAWGGLVRNFLQDEAHQALKVLASGEQVNVAGKVGKAFGDSRVMANMRAALTPQQFKGYQDLVEAFQAAGRSMDANSDTAFKQAWGALAKRRDMGAAAKALEFLRPWDKAKAAQEFFAERNYAKQSEVIAKIITSGDRKALQQLRQMKALKPNDWRRNAILGDVLVRGGYLALDQALE